MSLYSDLGLWQALGMKDKTDTATGFSCDIRRLRPGDAEGLSVFNFDSPADAAAQVVDDLEDQRRGVAVTLVAEKESRLVACAKVTLSGRVAWLYNVATHPDFRGLGVATVLIERLVAIARDSGKTALCAHVRRGNASARRVYEKLGMRNAGADGMRGEQLLYELRFPEREEG